MKCWIFFFRPLPSPRDHDYQEFVPITRKQARKLDAITKTGVSIEKYNTILHLLATENGKGILKFRRMDVSGRRSKFIVSIVAQPTSGYKSFATKDDQAYIWEEKISKPFVRDFDVPEGIERPEGVCGVTLDGTGEIYYFLGPQWEPNTCFNCWAPCSFG